MGRKSKLQIELETVQRNFDTQKAAFCSKYPDIVPSNIRTADDLLDAQEAKRREERVLELKRTEEIAARKKAACVDLLAVQWDAHGLYMSHVSIPRIIALTGMERGELQSLIYGPEGWKKERDALTREIKEEVKHQTVRVLTEAVGTGITLIRNGLMAFEQKCKEMERAPSLEECDTIAKVFAKLHKAKIIEEDGLDPSKRQKSLSPQELLNALATDAYLKAAIIDTQAIAQAEFEEVEEESVDDNSDSLAVTDR